MADDAKLLNDQGARALAQGNLAVALARFQAAARQQPSNSEVQFNLGLTLLRMGRPRQALAPLKYAVADPAQRAEASYLLGTADFACGNYAAVAGDLAGLDHSTHAEHVLYMVEESARLTGRQEDARAAFRELNRRFPDSAWTHYLMGSAYENQEDHARAIQEYQAALSRDAHIPNANFAIGYMQWRDRDYEAARPWLEKELAVQPCHALASYFLGELARDGRDLTGAVRHYQQAIRCGIAGPDAHLGLGVTFSEMNQDAAALRELQRAAAIDPTSAKAHYRLALIYRKLHRTADADREYRRVHELQQSARDKISLGMGLER